MDRGSGLEIRDAGAWERRRKLSNSRTPAVVGICSDHGSPGRLLFYGSSAELAVIRASILFAIGVITLPPMRPLAPLATNIAIMVICFCYIMIVLCLYSTAWAVSGGRVPRGAYGRRLARLSHYVPLACSILFCQVIDQRMSLSGRRRFSHFLHCCSWQPRWPLFTVFGECKMVSSRRSPTRSSRCVRRTPPKPFLNPASDVQIRTRQLMEDFDVSAADLSSVDVDRILAIRVTSPEQLTLMLCKKPERDAYLVAARLAFEDQTGAMSERENSGGSPSSPCARLTHPTKTPGSIATDS